MAQKARYRSGFRPQTRAHYYTLLSMKCGLKSSIAAGLLEEKLAKTGK
jgi:hypothetical protein